MSNDGDGYAPYEPPADVRNAVAAEREHERQRQLLMEALAHAEAPPLLPFTDASLTQAPGAAASHSCQTLAATDCEGRHRHTPADPDVRRAPTP